MLDKIIQDDNDYQRIQIVMEYIDEKEYTKEEIDTLLDEIKEIYLCDG